MHFVLDWHFANRCHETDGLFSDFKIEILQLHQLGPGAYTKGKDESLNVLKYRFSLNLFHQRGQEIEYRIWHTFIQL